MSEPDKQREHAEEREADRPEVDSTVSTTADEAGGATPEPSETGSGDEVWRDRYLRTLAELDNFRKRMERDRRQTRLFALEDLMRALLPVLDSLECATTAEGDAESIRQGVAIVLQDALRVLGEHGLEPIEAIGKRFDPHVHEALAMVPAEDAEPGTIVHELSRGFVLHDRVLRASRVQIAAEPPARKGKDS